jgi:hypothetical protein
MRCASTTLCVAVNLDGMQTPMTFLGPMASQAIHATSEESIPS